PRSKRSQLRSGSRRRWRGEPIVQRLPRRLPRLVYNRIPGENAMARSTSRQMYLWAAYVGLLLGCGWWEHAENREDIQRQSRWQAYIGELRVESKNHYDELVDWMGMNSSQVDARETFERRFAGEYTLTSRDEGDLVETRWVHSKYGYAVNV